MGRLGVRPSRRHHVIQRGSGASLAGLRSPLVFHHLHVENDCILLISVRQVVARAFRRLIVGADLGKIAPWAFCPLMDELYVVLVLSWLLG